MCDAEHYGFFSSPCCAHTVLWEKILPFAKDQNVETVYPVYNIVG